MTRYGGDQSLFEGLHPLERYELERMLIPPQPALAPLETYKKEWSERAISPPAVIRALGHIAGRQLNENDTRNATGWIIDEIEQYQATQGER